MTKKNIGKIITTGSAKKRAILYWDNIAKQKYFQTKLLTDSEKNQLSESFKKPKEIDLFNEFINLDETITNAILNLQGLVFEVKMHHSNLRGYILLLNSMENSELMVNSVLHEIKDIKERKRIAEDGAKGIDLLLSETEIDKEGYIEIKVDFKKDTYIKENGEKISFKEKPRKTKEYSLWYVMNNVKKEVETSVIKYLSWESATLDFMEERGFNIKTYKDHIKKMTTQVCSPIIDLDKYNGELNTNLLPHPRLEKIIKKYAICPNVKELKVDKNEYSWYRRYFLDGIRRHSDELTGKLNKNIFDE